jgi:hypothetical protein
MIIHAEPPTEITEGDIDLDENVSKARAHSETHKNIVVYLPLSNDGV